MADQTVHVRPIFRQSKNVNWVQSSFPKYLGLSDGGDSRASPTMIGPLYAMVIRRAHITIASRKRVPREKNLYQSMNHIIPHGMKNAIIS